MAGGTYTLIIERTADGPIEVGTLGKVQFPAGWYAYVGSARGPGGFARIDRHERVASRESEGYHWHVDCLLGDGTSAIDRDFRSHGADAECAIASRIREAVSEESGGRVVDGFGASDCDCPSTWSTQSAGIGCWRRSIGPTGPWATSEAAAR